MLGVDAYAARLADSLRAACTPGTSWTRTTEELVLQAAALIVQQARDGAHPVLTPEIPPALTQHIGSIGSIDTIAATAMPSLMLLDLLCRVPSAHLTQRAMATVTFAWSWIVASDDAALDVLVTRMLPAWQATVSARRGLFAGAWREAPPPLTPGDLRDWNVDAGDDPSE